MPVKTISLNLAGSLTSLSPMETRPIEFPDGKEFYKAESQATGGSQFQSHRGFRSHVYAMNCVPTENGYDSIDAFPMGSQTLGSNPSKIGFLHSCTGELETLCKYDPEEYLVTSTVNGSLISKRDFSEHRMGDITTQGFTSFKSATVTGILTDNPNLKGLMRAHGHIIGWTSNQMFYNGGEDNLDFTPSLRTGAGTNAILANIGEIQNIISHKKGIYIFGNRGGVYGSCTGDVKYPFSYEPIANHDGLRDAESVNVSFETETLILMSNTGLQKVRTNQAQNIHPDLSRALLRGVTINILVSDFETQLVDLEGKNKGISSYEAKISKEFRDNVCNEQDFYEEFVDLSSRKARLLVNNITPRYSTISYAKKDGLYNRLLVLDLTLNRISVIHVVHKDCNRPLHVSKDIMTILTPMGCFGVREGGDGLVLFMEFQKSNGRSTTISGATVYGRFSRDLVAQKHGLSIPFIVGLDQLNSDYYDCNFHMVGHTRREINYAGRITDRYLSFIVPFSGRINEVVLDHK